ncbi:hypothetical protein AOQ88_00200 [Candidatus Riesia sp. GBBU]|nr:hypothetical protein AOQ88_00200 [Candidatus Riesia sp. GBBU]
MIKKNQDNNVLSRSFNLFGGTFDPIHYGHLLSVEDLSKRIGLKEIILLPNSYPSYKSHTVAEIKQRINMIKIAIKDNPLFKIDTREVLKKKFSHTVETLISYRKEVGWNCSINFILGEDSIYSIDSWFKWEKLLELCNILVCKRTIHNKKPKDDLRKWVRKYQSFCIDSLRIKKRGIIYFSNTKLFPFSSKEIRFRKKNKKNCAGMLPKKVLYYIDKYKIYQ